MVRVIAVFGLRYCQRIAGKMFWYEIRMSKVRLMKQGYEGVNIMLQ